MSNAQMDEHRSAAREENIRFLMTVGLHRDQIARRLGISREALNKIIERGGLDGRQPDTAA
jgi:transposase-like protein